MQNRLNQNAADEQQQAAVEAAELQQEKVEIAALEKDSKEKEEALKAAETSADAIFEQQVAKEEAAKEEVAKVETENNTAATTSSAKQEVKAEQKPTLKRSPKEFQSLSDERVLEIQNELNKKTKGNVPAPLPYTLLGYMKKVETPHLPFDADKFSKERTSSTDLVSRELARLAEERRLANNMSVKTNNEKHKAVQQALNEQIEINKQIVEGEVEYNRRQLDQLNQAQKNELSNREAVRKNRVEIDYTDVSGKKLDEQASRWIGGTATIKPHQATAQSFLNSAAYKKSVTQDAKAKALRAEKAPVAAQPEAPVSTTVRRP